MKKLLRLLIVALAAFGLALLKITWGKVFILFSPKLFILPTLGAFTPLHQIPLLTGVFFVFKFFITGSTLSFAGIPTLSSLLAWSSVTSKQNKISQVTDFVMHFLLPCICVTLFVSHPNVGSGWVYSLYWIIPMLIYTARQFFNIQSTFFTALASSFVAHAVGSIIWLFTMPTTSSMWLMLLPIVAIERIGLATSNTLIYKLLYFILPSKTKSWRGLRSEGSSPFCISSGKSCTLPGTPTAKIISTQ